MHGSYGTRHQSLLQRYEHRHCEVANATCWWETLVGIVSNTGVDGGGGAWRGGGISTPLTNNTRAMLRPCHKETVTRIFIRVRHRCPLVIPYNSTQDVTCLYPFMMTSAASRDRSIRVTVNLATCTCCPLEVLARDSTASSKTFVLSSRYPWILILSTVNLYFILPRFLLSFSSPLAAIVRRFGRAAARPK
jgi:hypothetical protein